MIFPICLKSLQYRVQCKALHHLSKALAHTVQINFTIIREIRAHAEHKQIWQNDAAGELYHTESRNPDFTIMFLYKHVYE